MALSASKYSHLSCNINVCVWRTSLSVYLNWFYKLCGSLPFNLKIDRKTWNFDFCLVTWCPWHVQPGSARPVRQTRVFSSNTLLHLVSPLRAIQCLSGPYCHCLLPFLVSIQEVPLLEVLLLACYWSARGFLTFSFPCLCCLFLWFFAHVWCLLVLASVKLSHSFFFF